MKTVVVDDLQGDVAAAGADELLRPDGLLFTDAAACLTPFPGTP